MRDYSMMRDVLTVVARTNHKLFYCDFREIAHDEAELKKELARLEQDDLLDANVSFDPEFGKTSKCDIRGLTDEGREFYKLIENDEVWAIILKTLKEANIDVSYPLLKEVCEEIVKRYVTSFIPEI